MEIRFIDPTDVSWAFDRPAYRVTFWRLSEEQKARSAKTFELTGCHNVREALAWADENRGTDSTFTLYATVVAGDNRAVILLFGIDPTKHMGDKKPEWPGQVYEEV